MSGGWRAASGSSLLLKFWNWAWRLLLVGKAGGGKSSGFYRPDGF